MAKQARLDRRQRRLPRQAPGVRLPVRRDLRRHQVRLGLRPARRRAQGEHQAPVVALDGAVPRGRRRPRLLGDPAAPDLGGLGPRRDVHRPADRVPVLPQALPRRPPAGGRTPRRRASTTPTRSTSPTLACPNCGTRGAWTEPRQFSGLLKTYLGVDRGRVRPALPAPRDRAGHLPQLRQRGDQQRARSRRSASPRSARASATRSRPATSSSAPASSSRWRWSSSSSPARTRSGTSTGSTSAPAGTSTSASTRTTCGTTSTRRRSCQPLLQAHRRHRVPLQLRRLRVGRARGHRQPHRLRPDARTPSTPARTCPTSTRPPTSATCPTSSSRRPA